ncbi:MAG: gas vesicle protein K [Deltaproteobacteria bacterium]|nr:gas vesicle protein K [Deltaproteobacteria bacterium]
MATPGNRPSIRRVKLDEDKKKNGLAQLVLTVIKLLHELLEKQAIRRIDGGGLTDEEIERLGFTLMRQSEEIRRISKEFGLEEEDLNLDLGPLGKLL